MPVGAVTVTGPVSLVPETVKVFAVPAAPAVAVRFKVLGLTESVAVAAAGLTAAENVTFVAVAPVLAMLMSPAKTLSAVAALAAMRALIVVAAREPLVGVSDSELL